MVPVLVNFPLLFLELQRCITFFSDLVQVLGNCFFSRFAGTWKSGSARLLGWLTCALAVPILFCPVWCLLAAGGSGVMRSSSISCRTLLCCYLKHPRESLAFDSDI